MTFSNSIKKRLIFLRQAIASKDRLASPLFIGLLLLVVTLLSYGLVINRLGFYWDSWPMNWISQTRGNSGVAQYFSTNRPVWGLLYQLTQPMIGGLPLSWQIFSLAWRFFAALSFWWLIRLLWPRQVELALWASLLFIVYPGFQQQSIALLYSHFFIVLTAFLLSLACSLLSQKYPKWRIPILFAGLLLSAANLFMLEYFFLLEMLRPVILWLFLSSRFSNFKQRIGPVLRLWAPYLVLFLGSVIWRVFFFPYQTNNYQMSTLGQFSAQPLQTLGSLVQRIFEEIWLSTGQAWIHAANPPDMDVVGDVSYTRYILMLIGIPLVLFIIGLIFKSSRSPQNKETRSWFLQVLLLALAAIGLAGWPFWLTNVPFSLEFAYDRFTLPFILGASLLFAGLIALLPWRPLRWLVLAALIGLGAGYQYHKGLDFRTDWVKQQQFFWQLTWRIPHLQPGTIIFANENKVTAYSTDNSLTAPINWIYDPKNSSQTINFLLVYPTVRAHTFSTQNIDKTTPLAKDLLVGNFKGNVGHSISIFYDGFSCLRVLDPVIDQLNQLPEDALRETLKYSDNSLIQPLADAEAYSAPLAPILGQPPASSWCKLYESADLLRQSGKWYNIVQMWEKDQALYQASGNPAEMSPFIEAYARSDQWEQAAKLTTRTMSTRSVLCGLWQYLDKSTPPGAQKRIAVKSSFDLLSCQEYGIIPSQP